MKINFKKLHMSNFMSFANADVKLDDRNFIAVQGVNNNPNDAARSNGSGKSAIFDAIVWALTGDTVRGCKDVVNINGSDGAYVELDFEIDGDNYTLIRTKDHSEFKTNLKIYVNDVDKSGKGIRDSEKLLAEYLPDLTSELVGSVIVLGQGLPQRFTGNTPAGRKDTLEKLSKSDFMIEDLKKRVENRKKELATLVRQSEDEALTITTQRSMITTSMNAAKAFIESFQGTDALKNEAEQVKAHMEQDMATINTVNGEIAELQNQVNDTNSRLSKLSLSINAEMQNIASKYASVQEDITSTIQDLTRQVSETYTLLLTQKSELKKLQSITDVCPTCGQKLVGVEKPDTTPVEKEINRLETCSQALNSQLSVAKLELANSKSAQKAESAAYLAVTQKDTDLLNQTISSLNTAISSKQTLVKSAQANYENASKRLNLIEGQFKSAEVELASKQKLITDGEKQLAELATAEETLSKVLEEQKARQTINGKFSNVLSRDFRGCLLSSVIDCINATVKRYSQYVFNNDLIEFKLSGNNIDIVFQGKEYEMLSGGEKQKLDLIIQLAIRDMLCTYSNFSSNLIILDEIMDFLDADGCDAVINLMQNALSDVSSVFVVTHHTDLALPCDETITVIKDATGVSHIA